MTIAANDKGAVAARSFTCAIAELSRADIPYAGGKGANLGELTAAGLPVPEGFVVGAPTYARFVDETGLRESIAERLRDLDVDDTAALEAAAHEVRAMIETQAVPDAIRRAIADAYAALGSDDDHPPVAVRSSATAEDTASASFAGMNETFLNERGESAVVDAVRRCWGSLFGARTIFYRAKRGLDQAGMDIAVVVQRQLASTRAGVMFTVDPAAGREDRLVIEGSFGLGEAVVSGSVSPDRYVVDKESLRILAREVRHKELVIEGVPETGGTVVREARADEAGAPTLDDHEVHELAELGRRIERHYGAPQDTEWAYDPNGRVWILQSRPVTTLAGALEEPAAPSEDGRVLLRGLGAAPGSASGRARVVTSLAEAGELSGSDVLVAHMTTPDWVPLMRRASAIVTDSGGMTCHAAIVSRELGIPCLVGTGSATSTLRDGELVTVDAGKGIVLEGEHVRESAPAAPAGAPAVAAQAPVTATRLLVNLSEPSQVEHAAAASGRWRGAAASRADDPRGARGDASAPPARAGRRRRVHRPHGRGADHLRRRASPRAR